ncbi:MAG TPA: adenylate/guanylate cyclase domain-containing protein [bacterium]|nr:adenylate/guanylate cyclase domain-containing protein [bacterium]
MERIVTQAKNTFLFLSCVLLGVAAGAYLDPLAEQLRLLVFPYYGQLRPDVAQGLRALEPQLSQMVVGAFVFGGVAFTLASAAMSGFARSLLGALVKRLRDRDLLPYSFEAAKKRRGLLDNQTGILELFDSYVDQLHGAHSEKKRYESALTTYTDSTVAERLRGNQSGNQTIKTERRPVAVLFADIRGFTAMSEILMPEQVTLILNDYFTFSTAAVKRQGGSVNKFIGDAVMALFEQGPAYREGNAAKAAVMAAVEMQEEFARFMPVWKTRIPQRFEAGLGIGVHYGEAILGTLGSPERMEYTAIGDTVNFSSRLCSLAKAGQVRTSEDCFERVQEFFEGEVQEAVAVKGKTGTHATYVVGRKRTQAQ